MRRFKYQTCAVNVIPPAKSGISRTTESSNNKITCGIPFQLESGYTCTHRLCVQHLTNYLYTGREYDKLSGLYNYRHRFYHPGLGRFLQPDPIGFGGGLNFHNYVLGNPLSFTDPSGLDTQWYPVNGSVTNLSNQTVYCLIDGKYQSLAPGASTPNTWTTAWDVDGVWTGGTFFTVNAGRPIGENVTITAPGVVKVTGGTFAKANCAAWDHKSAATSPTGRGCKSGNDDPTPLLPPPNQAPLPHPPGGYPKPPTVE